ncbi:subtilisin-like protein [Parathielavia appendiculata]|uniref:Subtilisin-like protein n=1 Tax=Parathielavia appendiculata TaxID=2587402 RepID=A0AAN6YY81_9PEZI|nr:subtilisin-like protein [Parathielavia appendiculata]
MKISTVQSVFYNALGVLSLWATASSAQQEDQFRIALKLTPEAHQQQHADPNFITTLFQRTQPQGFGAAPQVTTGPLIGAQRSANISARFALAGKRDAAPNFDVWYQIQLGSESGEQARRDTEAQNNTTETALPQHIVELIRGLIELPEVESVHPLLATPPPTIGGLGPRAIDASDDPRSPDQGYLNPAPQGIDARYGWGFPGGDGTGVGIVDMEQGWKIDHQDFIAAGITFISGFNKGRWGFAHGTSVMGEMLMQDNQMGGVGIVPGAKGRVISLWRDEWWPNVPDAILDAVAHMSAGDILLLEAQEYDPTGVIGYVPVEVFDATFEAIQVATSLGIIVVEAGANGSRDLDAYTTLLGKQIFNRASPDYRESGAILVGAGSSGVPHYRMWFSNYGSRIDVFAWGENVDTTDTDYSYGTESWYTCCFSGTSSASPIVVGAAAILQGISLATRGAKMGPLEIRDMLKINGTPSADPAYDRISVMPNLKAIIDTVFNNNTGGNPDIYIRDHVGDTGDATSGVVSSSPDIIIRQQPIANPDAALGSGSGTETNPSLSQPVVSGQNHSLYVRLQNRGTRAASSANVTVYWSEPATLVTPNLWTEIGTATLPAIPATSNGLIVSPRLAWLADKVPASGHYCFVALAGSDNDPVPAVPNTFPDFVKFVRENNNAAWRNFNAIPAATDGWQKFPVTVPGAFDSAREFVLKAVGHLPQGSKVRLQVPKEFAGKMGIKGCNKGDKVVVGLKPGETLQVGVGLLDAGSLAKCELQVQVNGTEGDAEYALVQEWVGEGGTIEVGRVTWRFGPVVEL